jgi:hypothetical protein
MGNPYPEFFRYCRDKGSAFGHGARKRDPVLAWEETLKFLNRHTNYEMALPMEISLRVINGEFNRNLYEKIIILLGDPESSNEQWLKWRVLRPLDEAINLFIKNNCKYGAGYEYDMSIHLYLRFWWKNLDSDLNAEYKEVFERFSRHKEHGHFNVYIDNRLFIQPEFIVPLDNWERFHSFVNTLIDDLPFKFSNKSFISFYSKKLKNGKVSYKSLSYYGKTS